MILLELIIIILLIRKIILGESIALGNIRWIWVSKLSINLSLIVIAIKALIHRLRVRSMNIKRVAFTSLRNEILIKLGLLLNGRRIKLIDLRIALWCLDISWSSTWKITFYIFSIIERASIRILRFSFSSRRSSLVSSPHCISTFRFLWCVLAWVYI